MFKNNDKRFEYDISPHANEDVDRYGASHLYLGGQHHKADYPISATTPLNRRSSVNHSFDSRERHHISTQEPNHYYDSLEERQVPRGRGNSASGFKRSVEKPSGRHDKSLISQENFKQTKKVYFGSTDPFEPQGKSYERKNNRSAYTDENRRLNG